MKKTEIEGILGYSKVAEKILDRIKDNKNIQLLVAPDGAGKTHIAETIMNIINNEDIYYCLYLKGINMHNSDLGVFYAGLAINKYINKEITKQSASSIIEATDKTGFFSKIMDSITNWQKNKQKFAFANLKENERQIIYKLNSIYNLRPFVIIADDFHLWDESSIRLLSFLIELSKNETLEFTRNIRVFITVATEHDNIYAGEFLKKNYCYETKISYPTKDKYRDIVKILSIETINEEQIDELYIITEGSLKLTMDFVDYLNNSSYNALEGKKYTEYQDFIRNIINKRLSSFGNKENEIHDILKAAAIFFNPFANEEIAELLNKESYNTQKIIDIVVKSRLLTNSNEKYMFSTLPIKNFFEEELDTTGNKYEYHLKFAKILERIKSEDYFERYYHYSQAKLTKEAIELLIVFCLRRKLENLTVNPDYEKIINQDYLLSVYYKIMSETYDYYLKRDIETAYTSVLSIDNIYSPLLLAEKDYLLGLICYRSYKKENYKMALSKLEIQIDNIKNETDIWIKTVILIIMMYANRVDDLEKAKEYTKILDKRFSSLIDSQYINLQLNIFNRNAGAIYPISLAVEKTRRSCDFFKTHIDKYPIEYVMALTNHSGNLFFNSQYEDAFYVANEAIQFIKSSEEIPIYGLEKLYNNFAVSGVYTNFITPEEAKEMLKKILTEEKIASRGLIENNYAIFCALNNNLDEAYEKLKNLYIYNKNNIHSDYYPYLFAVNLASISFLLNRYEEAEDLISSILDKCPTICLNEKPFFIKRNQMLYEIIKSRKIFTSAIDFNEANINQIKDFLGKEWNLIGRNFCLTDMQYWAEY